MPAENNTFGTRRPRDTTGTVPQQMNKSYLFLMITVTKDLLVY